jgi:hypothetical protein
MWLRVGFEIITKKPERDLRGASFAKTDCAIADQEISMPDDFRRPSTVASIIQAGCC